MLYSNAFFQNSTFSHLVGLGVICNKTTNSTKILGHSERYSVKTFSICRQLSDMFDIELEFTESEIK